MSDAQGWQWVNEGKSPDRPKWGFVSETEGDSLAVQVCQKHMQSLAQEAHVDTSCRHSII